MQPWNGGRRSAKWWSCLNSGQGIDGLQRKVFFQVVFLVWKSYTLIIEKHGYLSDGGSIFFLLPFIPSLCLDELISHST